MRLISPCPMKLKIGCGWYPSVCAPTGNAWYIIQFQMKVYQAAGLSVYQILFPSLFSKSGQTRFIPNKNSIYPFLQPPKIENNTALEIDINLNWCIGPRHSNREGYKTTTKINYLDFKYQILHNILLIHQHNYHVRSENHLGKNIFGEKSKNISFVEQTDVLFPPSKSINLNPRILRGNH